MTLKQKCAFIRFFFIYCIFASILFSSCEKEEPRFSERNNAGTTFGRTVIVYMAAENSLSSEVRTDINEMLEGVKYLGPKDHLIVFVDDVSSPCIYDLCDTVQARERRQLSPVYKWDDEVDSCDPSTLDFILKYARIHYPSDSYALILWSHGSGWNPATPPRQNSVPKNSFGYDNGENKTYDRGSQMEISDIASVCESFGSLDYIFFDACFMQNIETCYQLRKSAKYIVGSPAEIRAEGAPYNLIMEPMFADGINLKDMIERYKEGYNGNGVLLSAVKTAELSSFAVNTAQYISKYKDVLLTMDYGEVLDYFQYNRYKSSGQFPDFYDMKGIMQKAMTEDDYVQWEMMYGKIFEASVSSATWYSRFGGNHTVVEDQYSGMSMHVPLNKYVEDNKWFARSYFDYDWAKTVWGSPQD